MLVIKELQHKYSFLQKSTREARANVVLDSNEYQVGRVEFSGQGVHTFKEKTVYYRYIKIPWGGVHKLREAIRRRGSSLIFTISRGGFTS